VVSLLFIQVALFSRGGVGVLSPHHASGFLYFTWIKWLFVLSYLYRIFFMRIKNGEDDKSKRLSALYSENENAKSILNDFADRFRKRNVTTLDQVLNRVAGVSRSEAIRVFRSLEDIGCGEFIEGRKGHPSRFAWTDDLTAVGRAARGEVPSVVPLENEEEEDNDDKKSVFEREHPL
jgi:hypothetical protein